MPMASSAAAAGAGPSAATMFDGPCQPVFRPAASSACRARATRAGSGPKSAAEASGLTVLPEAIKRPSRSSLRTLRPKLRCPVVDPSAGPRSTERLIAVASEGGGLGMGRCVPACWVEPVRADSHAENPTIMHIPIAITNRSFTGRKLPRISPTTESDPHRSGEGSFPDLSLGHHLEAELAVHVV